MHGSLFYMFNDEILICKETLTFGAFTNAFYTSLIPYVISESNVLRFSFYRILCSYVVSVKLDI